jgi:hypothetical protein
VKDELRKIVLASFAGSGVYILVVLTLHLLGNASVTGHIIAMILSFIFCFLAYNEL